MENVYWETIKLFEIEIEIDIKESKGNMFKPLFKENDDVLLIEASGSNLGEIWNKIYIFSITQGLVFQLVLISSSGYQMGLLYCMKPVCRLQIRPWTHPW